MLIFRWYRYLFYRTYLWRCSRPKTSISRPAVDAALFIAFANICYALGIGFIFTAFFGTLFHLFFDNIGRTKVVGFIFGVLIALFHIYVFVWNTSSKNIVNEFKNSNVTKLSTFAVLFYMVFSYFFFLASGLLLLPSIHERLPKF